jgi:hypothetical protein
MKRFAITFCTCWLGLAGVAAAQAPQVATVAPAANRSDTVPPAPVGQYVPRYAPAPAGQYVPYVPAPQPAAPTSETPMTPEARAHEQHLLQAQAAAESVHRAAEARFEQRTRRLESQRWYGISNSRPTAAIDPYDGDYSPGWVSNYPFAPYRWIAGGSGSWGFVEGQ